MRRIFGLLSCGVFAACGSSSSPSDGGVNRDASPNAQTAAKTIGAAGGTLALGPVALTVPSGAVAADTEFKITELSRAVQLPAGARAISKIYRLEPATTFAQPIRVVLSVDRAQVPARTGPLDGLLLLRAPSGTDDFEPIGAASLDAMMIEGETLEFSDIFTALFTQTGCTLPLMNDCNLSCVGLGCTGACTLTTPGAEYTASCAANIATNRVECSCTSDRPGAMPVRSSR
jgi:hypothetical protein